MSEIYANDELRQEMWGDRQKVARLLIANRDLICRRIRSKLRASTLVAGEPDDLFASLLYRLDLAVINATLRADCESEFWAFVHRTTDNLVTTRLRESGRQQAALHRWVERWHGHGATEEDAHSLLASMASTLDSEADRQLFRWRTSGFSYAQIAEFSGATPSALRTRMAKIKRDLRARFAPPPPRAVPGNSAHQLGPREEEV